VEVAHRPREGACTLRYRFTSGRGPSHGPPRRTLYGKVYPDDSGARVDGYLRALVRDRGTRLPFSARFPTSVAYVRGMRLLVTAELAGEAVVPRLLKAALAPAGGSAAPDVTALHAAVRDSGRALASLHSAHVARAPVLLPRDELASLRRDLDLVAGVWPDVAARVVSGDWASRDAPEPAELVLSHGDFTPSQVLLCPGRTPAVLDFDTLCWADPAQDIGRYLAHVLLLAGRYGDPAPGDTLERLAEELVGGYVEVSGGTGASPDPDRITFFMTTSLARAALNSCRQLKSHRLELALSLLDDI
jgi:hypothetical protein